MPDRMEAGEDRLFGQCRVRAASGRPGSRAGQTAQPDGLPAAAGHPIWWAALSQKAVETAAELADGWIPIHLIPEKIKDVWGDSLAAGQSRRREDRLPFDVIASVNVAIGDHLPVEELRDRYRPVLALYVGGMGARGANFYNDMAVAFGFPDEAQAIQDLYLEGKRDEAAAHVPTEWLEKSQLIGPRSYIRERLGAYKESGVTFLSVSPLSGQDPVKTIELMRELADET
jgi:alkanesulfonate monooxygenase SsuD/methylene tetrahydromethanopterin reductase-like flavin-dependent oxidoreductase (luciferase family)